MKTNTPSPTTPEDLGTLLSHAYLAYAARLEAHLSQAGLPRRVTAGAGPVLFALTQKEGVMLKDLGTATGLAPSTVTGVVSQLQKAGLVKRAANPGDGRSSLVSFSAKGAGLKTNLKALRRELAKATEAGLGETQIKQLKTGLAKVSANLRGE